MRPPKSILRILGELGGNLDEELARLALLRKRGKLPLPGGVKHPKTMHLRNRIDVFRSMVNFQKDGCWEWLGLKNGQGYGCIQLISGLKAHRLAFVLFNGVDPKNLVCHKCDNPGCVNPDHLFEGSHLDNKRDSVLKNRHTQPKGELNIKAKLTEADVRAIRAFRGDPSIRAKRGTYPPMAKKWGVSVVCIFKIIAGETWKHLL